MHFGLQRVRDSVALGFIQEGETQVPLRERPVDDHTATERVTVTVHACMSAVLLGGFWHVWS